MTMIQDQTVRSFSEYRKLKKRHQNAEAQKGSESKEQLLVPKRPTVCPECQAEHSFWIKAYYFRWAVEGDLFEVIPVPRYICRWCSEVVSVLFAFLVPYRQFTLECLARGVQDYILTKTSYREVASDIGNNDESIQRPSHSQIWTWVHLLAESSLQKIEIAMQRACMNAGTESKLPAASQHCCLNSIRAQSIEKARKLNSSARVLALVAILLQRNKGNLVEALQTYFLEFVQPPISILTGRGIRLASPQSLKHIKN